MDFVRKLTNKIILKIKSISPNHRLVFTGKELEKSPNTVVAPSETALLARLGATNWNSVDDAKKELLNAVLHRMKNNLQQRRVLATPFFRDFDK